MGAKGDANAKGKRGKQGRTPRFIPTLETRPLSSSSPLSTVHCPLSTVHCPLFTVRCPLSTVHYFFTSPSPTRPPAVAPTLSSLERGDHPSTRCAFSLVAFFHLPSSGIICVTAGSRNAASRTSQLGNCRVGTRLAPP